MSIFASVLIGVAVGFAGSMMFNKTGKGSFIDLLLGVMGAIAGRGAFTTFGGQADTDGINFYSIPAAVAAGAILLYCYHAVRSLQPQKLKQRLQRRKRPIVTVRPQK